MLQLLDNLVVFFFKKKIYAFDNKRYKDQIFSHYSYTKLPNLVNKFFEKKVFKNNQFQNFRLKTNKKLFDNYLKKLIFYKLVPINHQINLYKKFYKREKFIYINNDFDIDFLIYEKKLNKNNILYLNILIIKIKIIIKNLFNYLYYLNLFSYFRLKNKSIKLKYKKSILINEYFGLNLRNKNDLFFYKNFKK